MPPPRPVDGSSRSFVAVQTAYTSKSDPNAVNVDSAWPRCFSMWLRLLLYVSASSIEDHAGHASTGRERCFAPLVVDDELDPSVGCTTVGCDVRSDWIQLAKTNGGEPPAIDASLGQGSSDGLGTLLAEYLIV